MSSEEKEGPTVRYTPASSEHRCGMCKWLKNRLIRSGRDPQWECSCEHERADPHTGGYIGEDDETPDWCPMLKDNQPKEASK